MNIEKGNNRRRSKACGFGWGQCIKKNTLVAAANERVE